MEAITKATPSLSVDGFTFDLQRFATDTWDGTAGTVPDAVEGVITITTAEQLAAVAAAVNGGNDYSGVTIKLGADLDLNGQNWTPIGNNTNQFKGTFDGDNHTISNLTITGSNSYVGLFGYNKGTVSGCTVSDTVTGTGEDIGGVVGGNRGTVSGNTVFSEVSGNYYVGGLVGYNEGGTVSDNKYCSTFAAVGENDDGTVGTNTLLNKVTLPGGVTASGDTCFTVDGIAYAVGNITLAAKLGYVYSGTTSAEITADTDLSNLGNATLDPANHYVLADDTKTLATADNTTDYPDLVQVYELTVPDSLTVSGDIVATADGKTYAAGEVTLTAAKGYTIQSISVDGSTLDGTTFTVDAATEISAESFKSINGGKGVEFDGTTGDFSAESSVYSITASQQNSTLTGNNNNNTVVLEGGGENILTGGGGNDTYKFESGGGIVTDYGIGATKSGDGSPLTNPPGTDVIKLDGKVSGVYFDRAASSKKTPTFTAIVTYDSTAIAGDDTQIIVLQNINKKPTKYSSDPSKAVYQTNDAAAATLKIWDTSGTKQAVLSAAKLKTLFKDDDQLTDELKTQIASLGKLDGIGDLNLPAVDQLNQNTQATFNGGE